MTYEVNSGNYVKVILSPQNVTEEILQNVATILATPRFSVPLDRAFGLSARVVDKPANSVAETLIVTDILDVIERYEPRVRVKNITFSGDRMSGKLIPKVEVEINE